MTPEQAKAMLAKIRALVATDDDGPECSMGPRWVLGQVQEILGGTSAHPRRASSAIWEEMLMKIGRLQRERDEIERLRVEVARLRSAISGEQHWPSVTPLELAPQPPPANPPRGAPVWPMAIESAKSWASPRLVNLMHARDQQGRAKYGVPLCMGDGRDTRMDLLQELLDAIAYAEKYFRESGAGVNIFAKALVSMMDGLLLQEEAT